MFRLKTAVLISAVTLWSATVAFGVVATLRHESIPGPATEPPAAWPAAAKIRPDTTRPNLLVFVHPHCACTGATLKELAKALRLTADHPTATRIVFVRPTGAPADWHLTDTLDLARSIPHATTVIDDDDADATRFDIETSGDVLLYDPAGRHLLFHGGITASRGHEGDNASADALIAALRGDAHPSPIHPVFGCALAAGRAGDPQ